MHAACSWTATIPAAKPGASCNCRLCREAMALCLQVWGVPTTSMQCEWLGERVATVDVSRAISNVIHNKEDAGWGPNAVFRFPKHGGTGAIWKAVARRLPQSKQVSRSCCRCNQCCNQ